MGGGLGRKIASGDGMAFIPLNDEGLEECEELGKALVIARSIG